MEVNVPMPSQDDSVIVGVQDCIISPCTKINDPFLITDNPSEFFEVLWEAKLTLDVKTGTRG